MYCTVLYCTLWKKNARALRCFRLFFPRDLAVPQGSQSQLRPKSSKKNCGASPGVECKQLRTFYRTSSVQVWYEKVLTTKPSRALSGCPTHFPARHRHTQPLQPSPPPKPPYTMSAPNAFAAPAPVNLTKDQAKGECTRCSPHPHFPSHDLAFKKKKKKKMRISITFALTTIVPFRGGCLSSA